MEYNKLVRDNIPEIIKEKGGNPKTHTAETGEYRKKLVEKLFEEIKEFEADSNPEEIADICEVLDAICEEMGFDKNEIQKIKERKSQERGAFKNKIILEES